MDNNVRDIPVDKHFARLKAHDLVGRHARVRAPDPQILRLLELCQFAEELGVFSLCLFRPDPVLFEEGVKNVHDNYQVFIYQGMAYYK